MTGQSSTGGTGRGARVKAIRGVAALAASIALVGALATTAGAAPTRPSRRPSAPLGVTATAGPGQLVVSWSPPAYNGEYLNRHGVYVPYVITDYDLKGVPKKSWESCVDLSLSCTITGLRVGHTYEISVDVWNALGKRSPYSAPVAVTYTG